MARLTVLLIGIALLVLTACDGNGGGTPTPTAPSTAEPTSPPPAATVRAATATAALQGGREPVEVSDGTAPPTPLLVDVRTGQHEGFDRVVFEFAGALPGYRVEYVSPPITACGSGFTATIAGDAFLRVRMTPAAAHDEQGNATSGTTELTPGLPTLLEVESTCDFEGIVIWVLGLSEEVDFSVLDLADPFRIVVDVAHP